MKQILTFFLFCCSTSGITLAADQVNVLFIAIDDLNDWVGFLDGHPQAHTPNMDRLARRGITFTNAHCAAPACNPSRAAVFSGKQPWHTGVWSNDSQKLLTKTPEAKVIPRAFSDAGYLTMGTGKMMHGGGSGNQAIFHQSMNVEQRWSPFTRESVAYNEDELPSKKTSNPRHTINTPGSDGVVLPLNGMPSDRRPTDPSGESFDWGPVNVPDSAMGDTQSADWAIQKLKLSHEQPWFLGVGFYRPHIPLWAPHHYFDRFQNQDIQLPPVTQGDLADLGPTGKRWALDAVTAGLHSTVVAHDQWSEAVKAYLACTTFVDAQVGKLIEALDRSDYADDTIVVLWSDHGWHLGEKEHWGKWTGWERSTRVPLIIVPPRNATAAFKNLGQPCDEPVGLIDLYPTLCELCAVKPPADLDGESLVPLLRNPANESGRTVITSFDQGNISTRSARWRYIRYQDGSEELYDHRNDPNEWTNLSHRQEYRELLRTLRDDLPDGALGGELGKTESYFQK